MIRRSFLKTILALGAAPAIVRADSLMRIVPRDLDVLSADTRTALAAAAGDSWMSRVVSVTQEAFADCIEVTTLADTRRINRVTDFRVITARYLWEPGDIDIPSFCAGEAAYCERRITESEAKEIVERMRIARLPS